MEKVEARITRAIQILRDEGIEPILYGSAGASLYLGPFKSVADIDLLIDAHWLEGDWKIFVLMMERHGFRLVDEREHEFVDDSGEKLSFAARNILVRDQICDPDKDLVKARIRDLEVTTLSATDFRKAYLFSSRDGYRQGRRDFKDMQVIDLLDHYLEGGDGQTRVR